MEFNKIDADVSEVKSNEPVENVQSSASRNRRKLQRQSEISFRISNEPKTEGKYSHFSLTF
jgi:hypothetical protein